MACFRYVEEEAMWDGTIGNAEVLERPSSLSFEHEMVRVMGMDSSAHPDTSSQ